MNTKKAIDILSRIIETKIACWSECSRCPIDEECTHIHEGQKNGAVRVEIAKNKLNALLEERMLCRDEHEKSN